jgi:hypothetical protein
LGVATNHLPFLLTSLLFEKLKASPARRSGARKTHKDTDNFLVTVEVWTG